MTDIQSAIRDGMHVLRRESGESVIYARANVALTVLAVVGSTKFVTSSERGGTLIVRSVDFLIAAAELAELGGIPLEGDLIRRLMPVTETYEVVRFNSEPCWRWRESGRDELRIHTKLLRRD